MALNISYNKTMAIVDTDTNLVINKLVYSDEASISNLVFPVNYAVIDATNYAVEIGDSFIDGQFTREGYPVGSIMTLEETLSSLEERLEITQAAIDEMLLA